MNKAETVSAISIVQANTTINQHIQSSKVPKDSADAGAAYVPIDVAKPVAESMGDVGI